jgi:hypothetical protein
MSRSKASLSEGSHVFIISPDGEPVQGNIVTFVEHADAEVVSRVCVSPLYPQEPIRVGSPLFIVSFTECSVNIFAPHEIYTNRDAARKGLAFWERKKAALEVALVA